MAQQPSNQALIPSRTAAAVAVILTGFVASLAIREAVLYPAERPGWLLTLFFSMHRWALWTANAVLYGFVLWLCVSFFRAARGKERVVVGGWFVAFLLYPVEQFASKLTVAARYADAIAMGIAFLAAFSIFLSFFAKDRAQADPADDS